MTAAPHHRLTFRGFYTFPPFWAAPQFQNKKPNELPLGSIFSRIVVDKLSPDIHVRIAYDGFIELRSEWMEREMAAKKGTGEDLTSYFKCYTSLFVALSVCIDMGCNEVGCRGLTINDATSQDIIATEYEGDALVSHGGSLMTPSFHYFEGRQSFRYPQYQNVSGDVRIGMRTSVQENALPTLIEWP